MSSNAFIAAARAILATNDRGGYTVPTDRLYPFQWNWDSAFVAMGFATYDMDRALRELERLAEGQWADGLIPHIVFHQDADSYFPGPDVWRTRNAVKTSGITQPPVFAIALAHIAARAGKKHGQRIGRLYNAARAMHRWWARARDPEGTGLVAILHNWESGRDNSVEWDAPLQRVPETTTTPIRRRDTGHVDAAMRPSDSDYRRYIHLVDRYAALGWDPAAMWKSALFRVADIGTNAILTAAEEALAGLANDYGTPDDVQEITTRRAKLIEGLAGLWAAQCRMFVSKDLIADRLIPMATSAGLLPLLTEAPTPKQVEHLANHVTRLIDEGYLIIPSTFPEETGFEPKRYWRGPVWAIVNYLVARGFRRHGRDDIAAIVERETLAAMRHAGFCEYFDPTTREGLGGSAFSWTAAIALLLTDASPEAERALEQLAM